ncbi:MAG TPA: hypothetical protein VFM54_08950 [Micromonosporaceae bacterium]|nr:hypothetical protein [Micromonosporaceae bacterium]
MPSTAVTSSPDTTGPRAPAAAAVNNARSTATGNRVRACDNATAHTGAHITTAGLNAPSNGHNRVTTPAYPCP